MARNYYVVYDEGSWGVKLEGGRYVERSKPSQKAAKRSAIRYGLRNNRGVTVNAKDGYTRYSMSYQELKDKYGDKRWTPKI
jgi:hypothetical protein